MSRLLYIPQAMSNTQAPNDRVHYTLEQSMESLENNLVQYNVLCQRDSSGLSENHLTVLQDCFARLEWKVQDLQRRGVSIGFRYDQEYLQRFEHVIFRGPDDLLLLQHNE